MLEAVLRRAGSAGSTGFVGVVGGRPGQFESLGCTNLVVYSQQIE